MVSTHYKKPMSLPVAKNTIIDFNQVSFQFPDDEEAVFQDISFSVQKGERVVLSGPSGCGKSTLLYLMNRLYPSNCDGKLNGSLQLWNKDAANYAPGEINARIATVFQDPDAQFCMPNVEQEMAFTLENLHVPRKEMERRITETLEMTGLTPFRKTTIQTLSGGMKQRVATACAILMQPGVLLLDEPLAHLDPLTAQEYVEWLDRLQLSRSLTIVAVEHRLDLWGPFFDRAIHVQSSGTYPVEMNPMRSSMNFPKRTTSIQSVVAFEACNISVRMKEKQLLQDVSLCLQRGEIAILAGPNGSGKSTFLKTICGILKKSDGHIQYGIIYPGYVPQSPEHLFVTQRVDDEIRFSNRTDDATIDDIMLRLRLDEIQNAHPFSVSHGQKRRVAIGAMLADKRPVLLLDEPTSGQDASALQELFHLIDERAKEGFAILMVTHDMTFAAAIADTIFLLKNGELTGRFENNGLLKHAEVLRDHKLASPFGACPHV
ncbi:ABC transporter ATP-binding protein [Paenisporosarcina indica]|uniref:ABC transporter ATP-binding protein n=1 Tax=Paenisporosarcina indica TaxID=650093 RepID=UPI000A71A329|nr:ABC transporter ATP-binding protein [Paenisporosarcina indica]